METYKHSISLFADSLSITTIRVLEVDLGSYIVSSFSDFIVRNWGRIKSHGTILTDIPEAKMWGQTFSKL